MSRYAETDTQGMRIMRKLIPALISLCVLSCKPLPVEDPCQGSQWLDVKETCCRGWREEKPSLAICDYIPALRVCCADR